MLAFGLNITTLFVGRMPGDQVKLFAPEAVNVALVPLQIKEEEELAVIGKGILVTETVLTAVVDKLGQAAIPPDTVYVAETVGEKPTPFVTGVVPPVHV